MVELRGAIATGLPAFDFIPATQKVDWLAGRAGVDRVNCLNRGLIESRAWWLLLLLLPY